MQEESAEVLAVEAKFNNKRRPLWDERAKVIKSIPGFWTEVVRAAHF